MQQHSSQLLREIRISGGFLDGFTFRFNGKLNCIIGARGTGKTTFIEFIRYVFDLMPTDPAARKRVEGIVAGNLSGGRIEIHVTSKNGTEYIISRTQGEQPMMLKGDGTATGMQYVPALFGIDVFSQNEVESIADNAASQLALIESFDREEFLKIADAIRATREGIRENARSFLPVQREIAGLKDAVSSLPAIEEKLKSLANLAGDDSKKVTEANARRSLREREKNIIPGIQEVLKTVASSVNAIKEKVASGSSRCPLEEFSQSENRKLLQRIGELVQGHEAAIAGKLDEIIGLLREEWTQLIEMKSELELEHQASDVAYNKIIEKSNADRSVMAERIKVERERNELLKKKALLDEKNTRLRQLQEERTALLDQLSEQLDMQFKNRLASVDRINAAVGPFVKVTLNQFGDTEIYQNFLVAGLKGAQIQHRQVAGKIAGRLPPAELIMMIRKGPGGLDALMNAIGLNRNQAEAVFAAFKTEEAIAELEIVELPDQPRIELKDGEKYKATAELSTGQKCNAILPILLQDSDRPLIIDQPEDNLDNAFIHNTIVKNILSVKEHRQMVFVTHNPNIPVLGDAENMMVLESDGTCGSLKNSGSIEECKNDIVNLLEGGMAAFDKRQECYAMIEREW